MKNKILIIGLILLLISSAYGLTIDDVDSTPSDIAPGEEVKVRISLENNMGDDAENIEIRLNLEEVPFAPYQESSEKSIEDIDDGDDEETTFNLIAFPDAESGTYKIPVRIRYKLKDNNKTEEKEGLISLIITANPKLEIKKRESLLIKGEKNELTFEIINSGLGDAKFLSLKLEEIVGITILDSREKYIGSVESDDIETADFKVLIGKNAGSLISLPIKINYQDVRNNPITESKNVILKTYTKKGAVEEGLLERNYLTTVIIVIFILIILYIIYRKIRKKKLSS